VKTERAVSAEHDVTPERGVGAEHDLSPEREQGARSSRPLKLAFDPDTFGWTAIEPRAYKFALGDQRGMGWRGITRFTLGGPPQIAARFQMRYFEVAPGGYSSLEKHTHVHFVMAIRGRGRALVGDAVFDLAPRDLMHVPPDVPHRWINEGDEPFGFLCTVDAERDPPRPLSDGEWEALRANPVTAPFVF
jgi:quercetin dioxygenase-like cupin family protein